MTTTTTTSTTTGSSIISALDAGSGVDYSKLASDLATASYSAQRDQLTARKEKLEAQISAAGQLRSSLSNLTKSLGDRVRTGDLAPRGELGNASVARVSVTSGATPKGQFSLEVTDLAQSQTLVSRSFASRDALVGEGTLTLRFGTVTEDGFTAATGARAPLNITLTATDTLDTLATKINSAGAGVTAYVAQGPGGAQLVMKGQEGAANGFVLETASAAANPQAVQGDLSYLAWSPGGAGATLRSAARDAAFTLDGVALTSATNRVTGLPGGFNLTLTGTNRGAPTTLSFGSNSSAVSSVMTDLVSALNELVEQVNTLAAPVGGKLGSDAGARELKRDLSALTGRVIMPGAAAGEPRTLADLGVVLNRDGTFRLDETRLSRALESNGDAVAAMFTTGINGVYGTFDRLSRETGLASDPGSLGGSVKRLEQQLAKSNERLTKIAEQQEALRQRLSREFSNTEKRVSASQSTLEFLRQQVDSWSSRNR